MIMRPAPILLFTFIKLNALKTTIHYLKENYLAGESELYIYSDAPRNDSDLLKVNMVREYLKTVKGFKKVIINESPINLGLAKSIITGVTKTISKFGRVIVLEDDLQTSVNFLSYMNQALNYYKKEESIFSIAGFSMPMNSLQDHDIYFTKRASSWGWATWGNRWDKIDWEVKDYEQFLNDKKSRSDFNKMGSDMSRLLDRQMEGKIDSWAIRWCYHQFKNNLFTVHPTLSKVVNIGLDTPDATHTKEKHNRFKTELDNTKTEVFNFKDNIEIRTNIIRQFVKPYSLFGRTKYKIINYILANIIPYFKKESLQFPTRSIKIIQQEAIPKKVPNDIISR